MTSNLTHTSARSAVKLAKFSCASSLRRPCWWPQLASSLKVHPSLLWEPQVGRGVRGIPGGRQPMGRRQADVFSPRHCSDPSLLCVPRAAVTESPGRLSAELGNISGEEWPILNAEAFKTSAVSLSWLGCKSLEGQQWRLRNPWRPASELKVLDRLRVCPGGLPGWA